MEHLVTIELFGQTYTFKADTEAGKAQEIADLLIREVQKIQDQQPGSASHIPKLTILILAALNISTNIIQLKKDTGELVQKMAERCEALNHRLDDGLAQLSPLRQYG